MSAGEEDAELLKKWIIKKLEDISDADSDVLADYVLALVKSDDPQPLAKANSVENLKDFLGDNTSRFVDDVFSAIATKQYDPARAQPVPVAPRHQVPNRPTFDPQRSPKQSRKRAYRDFDSDMQDAGMNEDNGFQRRPMKQMRRGGRGFDQRGGRQQQLQGPPQWANPSMMQGGAPQSMPPGVPPFDPSDPWAMLNAMNQMLGMVTGMQQNPGAPQSRGRCRDYDTQGFCTKGASCPYEHGENPYVVGRGNQEYDPNNAGLSNMKSFGDADFTPHPAERGRGGRRRARGGNKFRGGNRRADISLNGPTRDKSLTTIVVEQIPDDKCDEQSVRDFFSEFGTIEEVTVDTSSRLAVIKYGDHEAAKSAYDSPKSIFDNRFVKVFWHKPEFHGQSNGNGHALPSKPPRMSQDVDMEGSETADPAEVAKRLEEAQKKYDEAKKSREDADNQRNELGSKLRAMEAERKRMAEALAKKAGKPSEDDPSNEGEDNEKTKALKEQLAKLEEEAKSLGIDPNMPASTNGGSPYQPQYRGRGGFRGRGRGRGFFQGFRGGRGGSAGGVMRLDNRPKTLSIVFSDEGSTFGSHEEKLGQFMLFNSLPYASISKHPDRDDAALISFAQRYEGENAMALAKDGQDLPYVGNVQLAWHKPPTVPNGSAQVDPKPAASSTNGHEINDDYGETLPDGDELANGEPANLDYF